MDGLSEIRSSTNPTTTAPRPLQQNRPNRLRIGANMMLPIRVGMAIHAAQQRHHGMPTIDSRLQHLQSSTSRPGAESEPDQRRDKRERWHGDERGQNGHVSDRSRMTAVYSTPIPARNRAFSPSSSLPPYTTPVARDFVRHREVFILLQVVQLLVGVAFACLAVAGYHRYGGNRRCSASYSR